MPFKIERNDITKMKVDIIVNAANSSLQRGGGVCGAIFSAAGEKKLQNECNSIGHCEVGEAVITKGYDLEAKYIIHTVGPVWSGGEKNEGKLLYNCYINSLKLALEKRVRSIAFPLISSGTYGYPKDEALKVASSAIKNFLNDHDMMVYLVVFDKKSLSISENLFSEIDKYIDDNYVDDNYDLRHSQAVFSLPSMEQFEADASETESLDSIDFNTSEQDSFSYEPDIDKKTGKQNKRILEDVLKQLDESFSEMLLRLIDEKGLSDAEAYKRANIDRRLFSKIRINKNYRPKKSTVIAFAIALELNMEESADFLRKAGFALSHSSKFDLIIEYFIKNKNYNIFEINEVLFSYDQSLLGA